MVPVVGCNLFIYLVFLLLTITRLSKADNLCQNKYSFPVFGGYGLGSYCEETLHNMNCSVGPRESIERDTTLECKIERRRGWEQYRRKLGNLRRCSFEDCEPSQLTSLRIVRISHRDYFDEENSFPTMELNFSVPKPSVSRAYRVGGISLTFSSDDDPEFETRYRLLDFSNYKYSSPDNDENHKRTLNFPCFMGYQHEQCQSDDYKVYSVSLKSLSKTKTDQQETTFTELTYNITVYNFYVYHPHLWKSTIAVTFFPGNKDVTFLFDPVPDSVTFKMYNISLINVSYNKTYGTKLILKGQSTKQRFMNLMDGIYYILIEVITKNHNCPESCRFTRSHKFTIGNPHPMQVAAIIGDSEYPTMTAISMVSGVVLSLVLLGLFTYYRWRKKHLHGKGIEVQPPLNGTLVHVHLSDSVATLQLFGSGDIHEHEKPSESENGNSGESPYCSSLSISRLQFKTIDCTLQDWDQSSQSSSNENCELLSPAADGCESTHSSCIPNLPCNQKTLSYHISNTGNYDAEGGKIPDSHLDLTNVPSSKEDKTTDIHNDENYSVCSENIGSSEIDFTDFYAVEKI